jgi:hypothetical protein
MQMQAQFQGNANFFDASGQFANGYFGKPKRFNLDQEKRANGTPFSEWVRLLFLFFQIFQNPKPML